MGSKVIYRTMDEDMPTIVKGHGHWLETHDGRHLLDYSSGPCCFSLGHSNEFIKQAIAIQMQEFPSAFSGFWRSYASERAGDAIYQKFADAKPGWFGGVIFQSAGGEAVDFACKLASQYHLEAGDCRWMIASRRHSFHGVGLLPHALSGYYPRYDLIEPYEGHTDSAYVLRVPHTIDANGEGEALVRTKHALQRRADKVAALIVEPVGGPPVGAFKETGTYLNGLRKICDDLGILLIFDEVLCGSGRCGYLSVAQHYDVWPDICILGKSLSGGYQPVSAIVISQKVRERIKKGSGALTWGTTYAAHSMGCAAVAATLAYMDMMKLWSWVQTKGDELQSSLEHDLADLPFVQSIRGMGYLRGISLVDPETGKPFPPALEFHKRARKAIYDLDVVVYTKGQTVNGAGDFIIVAPPFQVTRDEMYLAGVKMRAALKRVFERVQREAA
jgi:adenosylmethionine-8-amino-7-oxononanoate aminotransferase